MIALPEWLRKRGRLLSETQAPFGFPLVKSKCFDPDGTHVCTKENHSCMRRVINSGCGPWKFGWQTISKAARGVLQHSKVGCEVLDIQHVGH
eukprot:11998968-Karenia_brevis.AAC.1